MSLHQQLMDQVYDAWNSEYENLGRESVLCNFSELHQQAVILGNLNYQVENGGFYQWHSNNYSRDMRKLRKIVDAAIDAGFDKFVELKAILRQVSSIINTAKNNSNQGYGVDYYSYDAVEQIYEDFESADVDSRYYALNMSDAYEQYLQHFQAELANEQ